MEMRRVKEAGCQGWVRRMQVCKRTPTPLHPGSQMHAGVPVALLQYPAPHDLVSGAVIQASHAEDAFALAFAIVGERTRPAPPRAPDRLGAFGA